jgi:hypothetical protein
MIPGSANPLLLRSAAGGYSISRSLRFNAPDSAFLSRTLTTPTTQNTFTWAGWVKLGALSTTRHLFGVSTNHSFGFTTGNALNLTFGGTSALTTTAVFRDPSAWYHVVWRQNGTAHTIWVNNVSVGTATATSSVFNTSVAHQLGAANTANFFSGYLADIHFIDGQALDPSSFGEFDAITGVWVPKAYTGTYGTNGFQLDFSDNSAATATTLGKDRAGSNNWTPSNLSVTAGAGNDSLVDVPTNGGETDTGVGGEVRGSYCTLNPLDNGGLTLSNGNLNVTTSGASDITVRSTIGVSSGKWYWEVTAADLVASSTGKRSTIGISLLNTTLPLFVGFNATSWAYINHNGQKVTNNAAQPYGATWATGDIIGVAFDADVGSLTFYKNGVSQGIAYSGLASGVYTPAVSLAASGAAEIVNFGQRPFAYTAPSGFKALNTANLPAPVVTKPSTVMDVKLYTGNGSTQTISGLGFSPNLVWIKGRSGATDHALYDTVRGVQQQLESNTTTDETTESTGLTAFNSDGFALGALAQANTSSATYAAWCWDESVSAGFDIVTYTGNGSARTIAHSLGVAPSMIIVKARTTASTDQGWPIYHSANTAAPATDYLLLNSTAATADLDTVWNDTAPTSSVFSVGTNALVNANADTYVAYCFALVAGYSSFGSYTGNGSADGPFVYLGFRPALVIVKMSSSTGNWTIFDSKREGYNVDNDPLFPNLSNAEGTTDLIDITSNGFKVRTTDASVNTNAGTYVFAAWAESPFQYSRAR